MKYALIDASPSLVRLQDFDEAPPTLAPEKALRWVPVAIITATPGPYQTRDEDISALKGNVWTICQQVRDLTYVERRKSIAPCYAPIPEQLDMQYRDAVNGTTTWADHITAVKAAHPKPGVP